MKSSASFHEFESSKVDNITIFSDKVTQALLAFNDAPEGNKYTDQAKIGNQKFIINKVKLLNHRWIIANYSNGQLWGEVLLKYFLFRYPPLHKDF
jgi:hypothetical protein